jgi:hypothetical protein
MTLRFAGFAGDLSIFSVANRIVSQEGSTSGLPPESSRMSDISGRRKSAKLGLAGAHFADV